MNQQTMTKREALEWGARLMRAFEAYTEEHGDGCTPDDCYTMKAALDELDLAEAALGDELALHGIAIPHFTAVQPVSVGEERESQ